MEWILTDFNFLESRNQDILPDDQLWKNGLFKLLIYNNL